MKKILFLIESLSGGGAEKVLTDLVKNLDKSKFDVTIMTIVDTGIYVDDIKAVCKYSSFLSNPNSISTSFEKLIYKFKYKLIYTLPSFIIYRWYIKNKYDVEIAYVEGFVTKLISSSNNKDSKKLAWVHTDMLVNNYADSCYRSHGHHVKSYSVYDNVVCVSKSVADAFNKKFNLKKKTVVRYNPVNQESILLKSMEQVNIQKDRMVMVAVGRLVEQKGYDRLIKVCRRLKDDGFNFYLWIIGEGEQRDFLEKNINENFLSDTVKLLGFHLNPYPYLKQADFVVCSSRVEGFSTVITEAIILGKTIITTKCSGMEELLGNNVYGIITNNDTASLYLQLKKVLTEPQIIDFYNARAQLRSKEFSFKNTISEIEKIF